MSPSGCATRRRYEGTRRQTSEHHLLDHREGARGATRVARHAGLPFRHGLRGHDPSLRSASGDQARDHRHLELVLDDAREMLRFAGQVKQEFLEGMAVTQDQAYIRALAVDFFISLLNTVEAWAERTLDEIESWDDLSPDGKNERALEKF